MAPIPTNINNALPIAGAPVNVSRALPLSAIITSALPPTQSVLDSLPDQAGNHHPLVILRALPFAIAADGGPGLPASTVASGGWLNEDGTPASFNRLDEHVPNDADYIRVLNTDGLSLFDTMLGAMTDPGINTGHVVHIRARDTSPNGLTSILVNGIDSGAGAVFGELTNFLTGVFTTYDVPIAPADAAAITNYTDFRLQLVNNGGAGDGAGQVQISWVWFEVPGNPIFG